MPLPAFRGLYGMPLYRRGRIKWSTVIRWTMQRQAWELRAARIALASTQAAIAMRRSKGKDFSDLVRVCVAFRQHIREMEEIHRKLGWSKTINILLGETNG